MAFSLITTGDAVTADRALDRLVETAVALRELGVPREWDLDDALSDAAKMAGGPVIIVEPSDNIGGGAPGDGTAVLRAFLRHDIANSAVAIADADAVSMLQDAAPGETRRLLSAARAARLGDAPVELDVTLVSLSDGRFTLEDRNSHLAASQGTSSRWGLRGRHRRRQDHDSLDQSEDAALRPRTIEVARHHP